jgi:hypothetical protein
VVKLRLHSMLGFKHFALRSDHDCRRRNCCLGFARISLHLGDLAFVAGPSRRSGMPCSLPETTHRGGTAVGSFLLRLLCGQSGADTFAAGASEWGVLRKSRRQVTVIVSVLRNLRSRALRTSLTATGMQSESSRSSLLAASRNGCIRSLPVPTRSTRGRSSPSPREAMIFEAGARSTARPRRSATSPASAACSQPPPLLRDIRTTDGPHDAKRLRPAERQSSRKHAPSAPQQAEPPLSDDDPCDRIETPRYEVSGFVCRLMITEGAPTERLTNS